MPTNAPAKEITGKVMNAGRIGTWTNPSTHEEVPKWRADISINGRVMHLDGLGTCPFTNKIGETVTFKYAKKVTDSGNTYYNYVSDRRGGGRKYPNITLLMRQTTSEGIQCESSLNTFRDADFAKEAALVAAGLDELLAARGGAPGSPPSDNEFDNKESDDFGDEEHLDDFGEDFHD